MVINPVLLAIRDDPSGYLPEPSLEAFRHFRNGYLHRSAMEGGFVDFGYDQRKFHRWLLTRFGMSGGRAIADTTLVASFSFSEADGFHEYFNLLDEFVRSDREPHISSTGKMERMTLLDTLRKMRKQPALCSMNSFLGLTSYLMGDEHASLNSSLPVNEDRRIFLEFQMWIESEKNRSNKRRQWFKIIQFWSGGFDNGEDFGALPLFYKWLDEYSALIGREGFFHHNQPESDRC